MTTEPTFQPTEQNPAPPDLRALNSAQSQETSKLINCARPGIIEAFDAANQTATVQIAQQMITSIAQDGTKTFQPFSPLHGVPVIFPSGGGFTLTFPIAVGDECLIVFNDREIDNWFLSGGAQSVPTTLRTHDMSDAVCYVGLRSAPRALGDVSTGTAQLRSNDGTTYVEIAGGGIVNVVAPTQINLVSPAVVITGTLNVENSESSGSPCNINGSIIATGDIVGNGISLDSHRHGGVTTGAGDTGSPI